MTLGLNCRNRNAISYRSREEMDRVCVKIGGVTGRFLL